MRLVILALCGSVALVAGQSADECREGKRSMHDCMKTAVQQATGATVDHEQGRELFKQCLADNGCESGGREGGGKGGGKGGGRGERREQMKQCITAQLGFDPRDRIKECMTNAGFPPPDGEPTGPGIARRGGGGRGGHKGGAAFMKLGHKLRRVQRACADGNLEGALSCIRDQTGLDLENIDTEAIRTAVCAAKPQCDAMVPSGCDEVLRSERQAKHRAMCKCHQALADEVGREALEAAHDECKPDRPDSDEDEDEGPGRRGFRGRGGGRRGGRLARAAGRWGRRGGKGGRGPMKFLDMDCDAIGSEDKERPRRERPDFCSADFDGGRDGGRRGGGDRRGGGRGGRGGGRRGGGGGRGRGGGD